MGVKICLDLYLHPQFDKQISSKPENIDEVYCDAQKIAICINLTSLINV